MDFNRRQAIFEVLREGEDAIMFGKGKEYSMGSDDVNANFKEVADLLGSDPLTVAGVYFLKHIMSIVDFIQTKEGERPSGEALMGRIQDARNYLGILFSLAVEAGLAPDPAVPQAIMGYDNQRVPFMEKVQVGETPAEAADRVQREMDDVEVISCSRHSSDQVCPECAPAKKGHSGSQDTCELCNGPTYPESL